MRARRSWISFFANVVTGQSSRTLTGILHAVGEFASSFATCFIVRQRGKASFVVEDMIG